MWLKVGIPSSRFRCLFSSSGACGSLSSGNTSQFGSFGEVRTNHCCCLFDRRLVPFHQRHGLATVCQEAIASPDGYDPMRRDVKHLRFVVEVETIHRHQYGLATVAHANGKWDHLKKSIKTIWDLICDELSVIEKCIHQVPQVCVPKVCLRPHTPKHRRIPWLDGFT